MRISIFNININILNIGRKIYRYIDIDIFNNKLMTEGFQMKDREKWRNEHSKKELEITVDQAENKSATQRSTIRRKNTVWAFSDRKV